MTSQMLHMKVSSLVQSKRHLVDVAASTQVIDALAILEAEQVLAVPVYGFPGSWAGAGGADIVVGDKQYIGIVSVLDLVTFVLKSAPYFEERILSSALSQPVSSAIGSTDESLSLWVESPDKELVAAMEHFAKGVHRALVLPETEFQGAGATGVKMLTQTDVVSFFWKNCSTISSARTIFATPLGQLECPKDKRSLVTVTDSSSLIVAFQILLEENVHAAAVVDHDSGKLISIISISDLRGVVAATLPSIYAASVVDFLRQKHQHQQGIDTGSLLPIPLTVTQETSLGDAVSLMMSCRYHRAWQVNELGQPTDVITLTDVIRWVWKHERMIP